MDGGKPALALGWLKEFGASVCHYKVCSTFDSSPEVGSIGRAIEIAPATVRARPGSTCRRRTAVERYTAFGHLFAAYEGEVFRIDRHPVMSRHPVTPMRESGLRLHLARQTDKTIGLVDLATLARSDADARVDAILSSGAEIVLFDVSDALTQKCGRPPAQVPSFPFRPFHRGFVGRRMCVAARLGALGRSPGSLRLLLASRGGPHRRGVGELFGHHPAPDSTRDNAEFRRRRCQSQAVGARRRDGDPEDDRDFAGEPSAGRSVIVHSALGPETDVGAEFFAHCAWRAIGKALGRIDRALVTQAGLRRVVISAGDSRFAALSRDKR